MFRGVQSIEGRVVQVRIQTLHMLRRQLSQAERGESMGIPLGTSYLHVIAWGIQTCGWIRLGFQLAFQTMKPAPAIQEPFRIIHSKD